MYPNGRVDPGENAATLSSGGDDMGEPAVRTRKWTRLEYDRLAEAEILGPEDRIELLGGEMIVKEPQYSPHARRFAWSPAALEEGVRRRLGHAGADCRRFSTKILSRNLISASYPAIRGTIATRSPSVRS